MCLMAAGHHAEPVCQSRLPITHQVVAGDPFLQGRDTLSHPGVVPEGIHLGHTADALQQLDHGTRIVAGRGGIGRAEQVGFKLIFTGTPANNLEIGRIGQPVQVSLDRAG